MKTVTSVQPISSAHAVDLHHIEEILHSYKDSVPCAFDPEEIEHSLKTIRESISGNNPDKTEHYVVFKDEHKRVVAYAGFRNCSEKLLSFTFTAKPLELYSIFVHADHRKKGIGKKLVQYLINRAITKKYTEIIVKSAHRFKKTGWKFYEKLDFEFVSTLHEVTGDEEVTNKKATSESAIFRLKI